MCSVCAAGLTPLSGNTPHTGSPSVLTEQAGMPVVSPSLLVGQAGIMMRRPFHPGAFPSLGTHARQAPDPFQNVTNIRVGPPLSSVCCRAYVVVRGLCVMLRI